MFLQQRKIVNGVIEKQRMANTDPCWLKRISGVFTSEVTTDLFFKRYEEVLLHVSTTLKKSRAAVTRNAHRLVMSK